MIYIILTLISLSVLYIIRYFVRKNMRAAQVALVALLCVVFLLSWSVLFVKTVHPDYPAEEEIFRLLTENDILEVLSLSSGIVSDFTVYVLRAIVSLFTITMALVGIVLLHAIFHVTKAVVEYIKSSKKDLVSYKFVITEQVTSFFTQKPILKLVCRLNC